MVKTATVQAEPEWFDLKGSVEKTIKLIKEASDNGAELIAFPEVFIPGYPLWIWDNAADIEKNISYFENSLSVDSEEFRSIQSAAKDNGICVVLGFSERLQKSLYISQAIIAADGELRLKRNKLKPTHVERAIFGDGKAKDASSVIPIRFNNSGETKVGCSNCWEHAQPLQTFYGAVQDEEVHIGSWPPLSKHEDGAGIYSICVEGCQSLSSVYAIQNHCFYLFANAIVTEQVFKKLKATPKMFPVNSGGASCVFAPDGSKLTGQLAANEEGLLYCDLNKRLISLSSHFLDTVGHYSRPDIMSLVSHTPNQEVCLNQQITGISSSFQDVGTTRPSQE